MLWALGCGPRPTSAGGALAWGAGGPDRPLALFVDVADGPLVQLADDLDVTSLLNDRYRSLLLPAAALTDGQAAPLLILADPAGCLLVPVARPTDASAFLAIANAGLGALADHRPGAPAPLDPAALQGLQFPCIPAPGPLPSAPPSGLAVGSPPEAD